MDNGVCVSMRDARKQSQNERRGEQDRRQDAVEILARVRLLAAADEALDAAAGLEQGDVVLRDAGLAGDGVERFARGEHTEAGTQSLAAEVFAPDRCGHGRGADGAQRDAESFGSRRRHHDGVQQAQQAGSRDERLRSHPAPGDPDEPAGEDVEPDDADAKLQHEQQQTHDAQIPVQRAGQRQRGGGPREGEIDHHERERGGGTYIGTLRSVSAAAMRPRRRRDAICAP